MICVLDRSSDANNGETAKKTHLIRGKWKSGSRDGKPKGTKRKGMFRNSLCANDREVWMWPEEAQRVCRTKAAENRSQSKKRTGENVPDGAGTSRGEHERGLPYKMD